MVGLAAARGGSGDPSPVTALGVLSAMRACSATRFGTRLLRGRRGDDHRLGHVGERAGGAAGRRGGARSPSATSIPAGGRPRSGSESAGSEPDQVLDRRLRDPLPLRTRRPVDAAAVGSLRCEVICGAANNVLAGNAVAELLADRGILYAPDFIANVGRADQRLRRARRQRARAGVWRAGRLRIRVARPGRAAATAVTPLGRPLGSPSSASRRRARLRFVADRASSSATVALGVLRLGTVSYARGLEIQAEIAGARRRG